MTLKFIRKDLQIDSYQKEKKNEEYLLQIDSGYYCAGIIISNGIIIDAAPILNWTKNKDEKSIIKYFKTKDLKIRKE